MIDAELIEFAMEFRKGILDGKPSSDMCYAISAPLAALLHLNGVKVELAESGVGDMNHYWLRLADGRVLDPAAGQFNEDVSILPPVYLGPPTKLHEQLIASDPPQ